MGLNLTMQQDEDDEMQPRITVFGVGGAGGNAVNNMIAKELDGVEFVVANTDAQALRQSSAPQRVQLGPKVTEGLGAGAKPTVGAKAAEETIEDIVDHLMGAHMCFITAGMGGGTGTGAAPIIAQAAREMGILTVGVVTKPFQFEGPKRMRQADKGIEEMQKVVDTLIIIPNQNLFRLANEKTTFTEAFQLADDVLYQGVKGVTDLMVRPGLINLDFADVRSVMDEMGKAMMGTGEGNGETRAKDAAERAIANPLLDDVSLKGAKGVLINITGGYDMTLFELDEAANVIRGMVDEDAHIIVGSTLDTEMEGSIRVSVVATGIDAEAVDHDAPPARRVAEEPKAAAPVITEEVEDDLPPRRAAAPVAQQNVTEDESDDVPPPAYAARQNYQRPQQAEPRGEEDAFFAPKRPTSARGETAEQVKARLQRAVENDGDSNARDAYNDAQRNQGRMSGLGRMLDRMTGHADQPASRAGGSSIMDRVNDRMSDRGAAPRPQRSAQPKAQQDFDDLASPDNGEDDIEIPAFLRRQAN